MIIIWFTVFIPPQNHSCDPNCIIALCYINDADINKPLLAIFTTQDISPWGELCFSYAGFPDDQVEVSVPPGLCPVSLFDYATNRLLLSNQELVQCTPSAVVGPKIARGSCGNNV